MHSFLSPTILGVVMVEMGFCRCSRCLVHWQQSDCFVTTLKDYYIAIQVFYICLQKYPISTPNNLSHSSDSSQFKQNELKNLIIKQSLQIHADTVCKVNCPIQQSNITFRLVANEKNRKMSTKKRRPTSNGKAIKQYTDVSEDNGINMSIIKTPYVANNSFTSNIQPKRVSFDIRSFLQLYRKKSRNYSISRQFEKSAGKMKESEFRETRKGFKGAQKKHSATFLGKHPHDRLQIVQNRRQSNQEQRLKTSENYLGNSLAHPQLGMKTCSQTQLTQNLTNMKTSLISSKNAVLRKWIEVNQNELSYSIPIGLDRFENKAIKTQAANNFFQGTRGSSYHFAEAQVRHFRQKQLTYKPNLMYNLSLYRKKFRNSYNQSATSSGNKQSNHPLKEQGMILSGEKSTQVSKTRTKKSQTSLGKPQRTTT